VRSTSPQPFWGRENEFASDWGRGVLWGLSEKMCGVGSRHSRGGSPQSWWGFSSTALAGATIMVGWRWL